MNSKNGSPITIMFDLSLIEFEKENIERKKTPRFLIPKSPKHQLKRKRYMIMKKTDREAKRLLLYRRGIKDKIHR